MAPDEVPAPGRAAPAARLDLVPISPPFVRALVDADAPRASAIIGAAISRWLVAHPEHVVRLALAETAAGMPSGAARIVVLVDRAGRRRAIGSVGFHGPPDESGRLEVGCEIDPASRGRGYAARAMTALLEEASGLVDASRFVVAVSPSLSRGPRLVTR